MIGWGKERGQKSAFGLGSCRQAPSIAAAAALTLQLGAGVVQAAAPICHPIPARATSVQGSVETKRAGTSQWLAVKLNDTFCPGDVIQVSEHSRADVMLLDQSVLRLNANASITVQAPEERRKGVIDLLRGAVHFFARGPNSLDVNTPFTVAGVRGTEFLVTVEAKRTLLTVFEGTVVARNRFGSLTLTNGQSATAEAGKAPTLRFVLHPRDAVQWTLYYPPVVYFRPGEVPTGARLYAYRAQRLLAVGSVDEAHAQIARALQLSPDDADALSLEAVMTLVQGNKDHAFEIAKRAVNVAPNSATAHIALSYAQQARFDLSDARGSVQRALELEPRNALAWARLAELDSSLGEREKAIAAAQRAAKLQPELSLTQTVLGFAQLISIDIREAEKSFEKAIALDQADPLPRLGLGLAKIRDGDLDGGGRELEIAASLDPGNSLVRSYLGKTYYEEKRTPRAEREFGVAEKLDPKDPTPWFYEAIAKQTTNRPVEALEDLEKARQLNDNRAVYRSKLLLDSDAAARAASQARIYSDLGFQQRALVEGWDAVNLDPTNSSAHRFLADSYSALPRHEIARVSELLQSQLLQPLNSTPIQPRLAESNLGLISAEGPGTLSFNEFNPLFNRDGMNYQATGLIGEQGTRAGEAVAAGIFGKASLSIGYFDFSTNGWRNNANQNDKIGNAFVQVDVSPDTSLQAEFRNRRRDLGDPTLRFFDEDYTPSLQQTEDLSTYRVGLRHALAPDSILLGSLIYQNANLSLTQQPNDVLIKANDEYPGMRNTSAELQHLYRSSRINVTSGIGYVDLHVMHTNELGFAPPLDFLNQTTTTDESIRHSNAYVYTYLKPAKSLTLTIGGSYDKFQTQNPANTNRDQFNPKFGLTWDPLPGTTLRAASFRVLTRSLVNDQTLEPTQVAGFNQFYDDPGGTDSRKRGVAIDQKFSRTLFGGIELSRRELSIPFTSIDLTVFPPVTQVLRGKGEEHVGRAYLFWTPSQWMALSAEYLHQNFHNDDNVAFFYQDVVTDRIPLGVKFFLPSGLSFSLRGTSVKQHGDFRRPTGFEYGEDSFFLVDAALGYRLPKRYGMFTVGVANLTNEHFRYQETDPSNASILPVRTVFARLTLAF